MNPFEYLKGTLAFLFLVLSAYYFMRADKETDIGKKVDINSLATWYGILSLFNIS